MDYVERLARELVGVKWDKAPADMQEMALHWAEDMLNAIAATGGKVTAREPTEAMCNAWWDSPDDDGGQTNWRDMHDAAPACPEDDR